MSLSTEFRPYNGQVNDLFIRWVNATVGAVWSRLNGVTGRLEGQHAQIGALNERLDSLEMRVFALESIGLNQPQEAK